MSDNELNKESEVSAEPHSATDNRNAVVADGQTQNETQSTKPWWKLASKKPRIIAASAVLLIGVAGFVVFGSNDDETPKNGSPTESNEREGGSPVGELEISGAEDLSKAKELLNAEIDELDTSEIERFKSAE